MQCKNKHVHVKKKNVTNREKKPALATITKSTGVKIRCKPMKEDTNR